MRVDHAKGWVRTSGLTTYVEHFWVFKFYFASGLIGAGTLLFCELCWFMIPRILCSLIIYQLQPSLWNSPTKQNVTADNKYKHIRLFTRAQNRSAPCEILKPVQVEPIITSMQHTSEHTMHPAPILLNFNIFLFSEQGCSSWWWWCVSRGSK